MFVVVEAALGCFVRGGKMPLCHTSPEKVGQWGGGGGGLMKREILKSYVKMSIWGWAVIDRPSVDTACCPEKGSFC